MTLTQAIDQYPEIRAKKHCISRGRIIMGFSSSSQYIIYMNYQPLLKNWDAIYHSLNRKTIKPINEYNSVLEFKKDANKMLLNKVNMRSKGSASYQYEKKFDNLYNNAITKIFEKMLSSQNIKKFKKPIIMLSEFNHWERERWNAGILVTEDNREDIIKLFQKINSIHYEKNETKFNVDDVLKEYDEIEWEHSSGYLCSPFYVGTPNLKKILKQEKKELIIECLYKGGINNL